MMRLILSYWRGYFSYCCRRRLQAEASPKTSSNSSVTFSGRATPHGSIGTPQMISGFHLEEPGLGISHPEEWKTELDGGHGSIVVGRVACVTLVYDGRAFRVTDLSVGCSTYQSMN